MPYIENEILERLITTMVEGFARVEKETGPYEPSEGVSGR